MPVQRIDNMSLDKILNGSIKQDASCIVKFYSNDCHLCQALQEHYENLSKEEQFSDLHFFAFNIDDNPTLEKRMSFNGVPTIAKIEVKDQAASTTLMPEPTDPHPETWYRTVEIRNFIQKEKK